MQVQKAVPDGIAIAQDAIVRGSDLDAEVFPKASEVPQIVKQLAFGLSEGLHFLLEPGIAQQRPSEDGAQFRSRHCARIASDKTGKIGRERGTNPA